LYCNVREIVNGGLVENSSTTSKSVLNKSRGKNASPTKLQVIDAGEIERIQRETRIITAVELEEIQANNDAEQERQRLSMKARKVRTHVAREKRCITDIVIGIYDEKS
jgi:hypothetical protein